jgi:hypothetical protein
MTSINGETTIREIINTETRRRAMQALGQRRKGARLSVIAAGLGVTSERARQLILKGVEIERRQKSSDPWDELSTRVRNALRDDACPPSPAGVRAHYTSISYRSHVYGDNPLVGVPNIGERCIIEVQAWLARHGENPFP